MSSTQPVSGRQPLNLSSNNPFRNRAASPNVPTGVTSPFDAPARPVSRNPFLDIDTESPQSPFSSSPDKMTFPTDTTTPASGTPPLTGSAAELFDNLTLGGKPSTSNGARPSTARAHSDQKLPPPYSAVAGNRNENVRPRPPGERRPSGLPEKRGHRTTNSGGESGGSSRGRQANQLDIFADPVDDAPKRGSTRRNSDSSVMERSGKALSPEEEKERQERRRRERRHREKSKDGRPKRPNRKLDIIDKLDVTSIYGTGLFHHDGPFDACNPHRNRTGSRRAPMQAFPKDSLNNALGGGGPVNRRPDHSAFLGNNDEEAFKDYSTGNGQFMKQKTVTNVQSAATTLEPIHGEESLGLGTSTFLEGAPASRTAMQRRESESGPSGTALGRKKSLAQKIRGINTTRRDYGPGGRLTGPDGVYSASALSPSTRTPGGSRVPDRSLFSDNADDDDKRDVAPFGERKGSVGPVSPERLERRVTSDSNPDSASDAKPAAGFLSRVKSLKGGPRKPREGKPVPQLPVE